MNPEAQAYGMLGLVQNKHTNTEDKAIIEHLLNKSTRVNSCSGCNFGNSDYQDIYKEILLR